MWTYSQSSGNLNAPDMTLVGQGYSGAGPGMNNPAFQDHPDFGPIPQGRWIIGLFFDDENGKGPVVCHLSPVANTQTFGRSGFMIHGDNSRHNHSASEGCVILARVFREQIAASGDMNLLVIG